MPPFSCAAVVATFLAGQVHCADEVSLIQDVRSKLAIQRPASHSASGLIEVATQMLRNGQQTPADTAAAMFVGQITDLLTGDEFCAIPTDSTATHERVLESGMTMAATTVGVIVRPPVGTSSRDTWDALVNPPNEGDACSPGAFSHITHAHAIDQAFIHAEHAKFGEKLDDLSLANDDVARLRNNEISSSTTHVDCRKSELTEFCNPKRQCDTELHTRWVNWYNAEDTLSRKHVLFHSHFCYFNGTDASVRTTSAERMGYWITAESHIAAFKQAYVTYKSSCETLYTELNEKTAACDVVQATLQSRSVCYKNRVVASRSDFLAEWNELLVAYGWHTEVRTDNGVVTVCPTTFQIDAGCTCSLDGTSVATLTCPPDGPNGAQGAVETMKESEHDRIQEWVTLKTVQCLITAIGQQNGVACDSTTTNAITTTCHATRDNENIDDLQIEYRKPPDTPEDCQHRVVNPYDVFGGPDHKFTDVPKAGDDTFEICVAINPHTPCSPAYVTQEFHDLDTNHQFPGKNGVAFSSSNPACNPHPSCDSTVTTCEDAHK